ncbi:peptide chain release factor N(5)-glutamine methyltransferase [Methylothermus subterraneus]
MTCIATLLCQGSARLANVSPTPRLDAELLLACAAGRPRAYLWAWPQAILPPEHQLRFWQLIERRVQGEPVAYLTGRREFWSREFEVNPCVLIPRPETELLVERALGLIPPQADWRIADLGTGSGAIAISLSLERPRAQFFAVDLCPKALAVAKSNARRLKAPKIAFVLSDWLCAFAPHRFDLIVSNPPYVAEGDPHLQGEIRFEPPLALVAEDGLAAFRRLIPQARQGLRPGGWLLLEHGQTQAGAVAELLQREGFENIVCYRDLEDRPRLTQARRRR